MSQREANTVRDALGFGAMTGLRSMSGPAALARAAKQGRLEGLEKTSFRFLGKPWVAPALYAMAVGEMVADKYPGVGSRLSPPPLLGRAALGALSGSALFASAGRRSPAGALLGLLSAVTSAFVGYHLRAEAGKRLGVPDPVIGHIEDGVVLLTGAFLTRNGS